MTTTHTVMRAIDFAISIPLSFESLFSDGLIVRLLS